MRLNIGRAGYMPGEGMSMVSRDRALALFVWTSLALYVSIPILWAVRWLEGPAFYVANGLAIGCMIATLVITRVVARRERNPREEEEG
jgi:hypothetical protein